MRTASLEIAGAELDQLIDYVQARGNRVFLTRDEEAVAVLVSAEELNSLEETIEVLSETGTLDEILQARSDISAGKLIPADKIRLRQPRSTD